MTDAPAVTGARPLTWRLRPLSSRSLGEDASAWDRLLERMWGGNPLLGSVFINHLLRYFGDGLEYLCIGIDGQGVPQAMAIVRRVGVARWQSFLPSQAQIGPTLVSQPDQLDGLLEVLPGYAMQLDLLCNDSEYGDLSRCDPTPNSTWHALTTAIDLQGDFGSYWAGRPTSLRQNVGRHSRKLERYGSPRYLTLTDPEQISGAIERYGALESSGWKGRAGTALFHGSRQFEFYKSLLGEAALEGRAEAHELWVGDELLASRLALVDGHCVVMLKTTYKEQHASLSPGQLLLQWVIARAFERHQGKRIEFYTNARREQEAWSTGTRAIRHISLNRFSGWREVVSATRSLAFRNAPPERLSPRQRNTTHALSVERYSTIDNVPADVCRLFADTERQYGFQAGVDWFRNLCLSVPPLRENSTFEILRREGDIVAALPLYRVQAAGRRRPELHALSNFYSSIYAPPIARDAARHELVYLLRAAMEAAGDPDILEVGPMDPHSREFSVLRAAMKGCGLIVIPSFYFGNWVLPVQTGFESYMRGRPGSLRSTLRRMSRKFTAAGGVIEVFADAKEVEERGLKAYSDVYAASWKRAEPFPDFIPGLIRCAARRNSLRLGVAWLGSEPIAAQLWILHGGRAEIFKLAHDERFKSFSPGTLLTAALMEMVFNEPGVKIVDYLTGDDPYKRDWMINRGERWGLTAYNTRTVGGVAGLLKRLTRRIGRGG